VRTSANVSATVVATAATALTFQWRHNGTALSNHASSVSGSGVAGANTATLSLSNIQSSDAGNYDVVISSATASTTSAAGVLTVVTTALSPQITTSNTSLDVNAPLGARVLYRLSEANNVSLTSARWYFDNQEDTTVANLNGAFHVWNNVGSHTVRVDVTDDTNSAASANANINGTSSPIGAGRRHTCALTSSGTVKCWGGNNVGQLGVGSTSDSTTPATVPGLSSVVGLAIGEDFSCALQSGGTASCWGYNNGYNLGYQPSGNYSTSPSAVLSVAAGAPFTGIVSLSAGRYHVCAVKSDSTVACWGTGTNTGLPDTAYRYPQPIAALTNVVSLATGDGFTCALKAAGTVSCWGDNSSGQLGANLNTSTPHSYTPVPVVTAAGPVLDNVVAIKAGFESVCVLRLDNATANATATTWCWGARAHWSTGSNFAIAAEQAIGSGYIEMLSSGHYDYCSVTLNPSTDTNAFACVGRNIYGETTSTESDIAAVSAGNVDAVTGGEQFTCTLQSDNKVLCWGENDNGAVGNGTTNSFTTPQVATNTGWHWWSRSGN